MDNNKETGSYYTPYELVNFMCRYLQNNHQDFKRVLEPSAGDGRFLSVMINICENVNYFILEPKLKFLPLKVMSIIYFVTNALWILKPKHGK